MTATSFPVKRNDSRISLSLRQYEKQLTAEAAALSHQSANEFIVSAALERSQNVIECGKAIRLSREQAARFLDALETPPSPNQKLIEAARRYQQVLDDETLETVV